MRKHFFLISFLCFATLAFSQQKLPNNLIGKNESEITLFYFLDNNSSMVNGGRDALGGQFIYRWALKRYTKAGAGFLFSADFSRENGLKSDVFPYGAIFADITQFIGSRQKWSVTGEIGQGIYNREYNFDDANAKSTHKFTGGFYCSVSTNYRAIISKKTLLNVSFFWSLRNFRKTTIEEYYLPPTSQRIEEVEEHSGLGIKLGIVI